MLMNNKSFSIKLLSFFSVYLVLQYVKGFVPYPEMILSIIQYLFMALGLIHILKYKIFHVNYYIIWGLSFILVLLTSLLWSPNLYLALWETVIPFIIQFILYASLTQILSINDIDKYIKMLCLSGLSYVVIVLIFYTDELFSGHRFGYSLGFNPNDLMIKMIVPATLLFYLYITKEKNKIVYFVSFIVTFFVMICSGSRKSVLLLIYISVFVLLKTDRNKMKTVLIILFIVIVSIYLIYHVDFLYSSLGRRIDSLLGNTTSDKYLESSDNYRKQMRNMGFMMFLEKPILGWGCQSFQVLSGYGMYSHCNYSEILCSYGIVGGVVYYSLPIFLLIKSLHRIIVHNSYDIRYCYVCAAIGMYLIIDWGCVTTFSIYNMMLFSLCSIIIEKIESENGEEKHLYDREKGP